MGASLFHSTEFRQDYYDTMIGERCYEVVPVDGESENITHGSLWQVIATCETLGMPAGVWPLFMDYSDGILIPLDEVAARQEAFRKEIASLPSDLIDGDYWLSKIADWLRQGEQVFICR